MKLSLIIICILASVWTGSAFAYDGYNVPCGDGGSPGCYCDAAGSCGNIGIWDDNLETFTCSSVHRDTPYQCTCTDASYGVLTFNCGCYDDNDCPESHDNGYGCINNRCQKCVSTYGTTYGAWTANGTGYQKRTVTKISCSGSKTTYTEYQCAAGYYGSSTNGTSGCSQCPQWSGVYTNSGKTTLARGTSSAGATAITGCYVAPGTYYDATGTFKTTSNCAYK